MAIIYSYPLNDNIKLLDELVGTTEKNINGQLKTVTRNFLLQDLAEFFIVDGGLQKTITLTTIGDNGAATLDQVTGILNIPEYAGLQNLQQVTDLGNVTSNSMRVELANSYSQINVSNIGTENTTLSTYAYLRNNGSISIKSGAVESNIKNAGVTNSGVILEFPNKTSGSYTIATTSDVIVQNLQQVTDEGASTNNTITINPIINTDGLVVNASGSGVGVDVVSINSTAGVFESTNGYGINSYSVNNAAVYAISASDHAFVGSGTYGMSLTGTSSGITVYANEDFVASLNQGITAGGLIINSGTSSTGNFIELNKNGVDKFTINQQGEQSIVKIPGGTSSQFLKANGTVDSSVYTTAQTLQQVTNLGATTTNSITANSFIKSGGTFAQLLAANGDSIVAGTNITISNGEISSVGGSGGSSVNFYLNGSIASSVAGYQQIGSTAVIGGGTDFTLAGNGTIAQFITDVGSPNRLEIPAGAWTFELWLQSSVNNSSTKVYVELYKYNGAFTSIASNILVPINLQTNTNTNLYITNLAIPQTTLLATDRFAIRVIAINSSGGHSVTLHTEDGNLCEILTNFVGGIVSINGITQPTQTLAVGTTGSDFGIVSSGSTHTFNLPSASATARGVVTTGTQTFAGAKTFNSQITSLNGILGHPDVQEPYNAWTTNGSYYDLTTLQPTINLTTTGTSGAATFNGITLNIPQYNITLSAIGAVPNANAATITGSVLNLQPASASFGGVVTTGTQTFAGDKSFTGTVDINLSSNALKATSSQAIALDVVGGNNSNPIAKFTRVTGSVEVARIDNNGLKLQLETASTIASFDANKNVVSLPTTTYPSLTELTYVRGVTSAIQTQFSGKQPLATNLTSLAGLTYSTSAFVKMTAAGTFTLDTSGSGVTTFSGGTTGLTPSTATSGAVTLGGTLNILNGGTGATTATAARINLGGSELGINIFTAASPSAITFLRINSDNTPSYLNAADFRTAIGIGSIVSSLSAIGADATANANGATITGSVLNLQPATAGFGGVITTGAQTIAGVKTFNSSPIVPTKATGTNNTEVATTAFVTNSINAATPGTGYGVFNILITSTSPITTLTTGSSGSQSYSQNGRNVMIQNSSTNITITVDPLTPTDFIASYTKLSVENVTITFLQTNITTWEAPNGYILSGRAGSTALLTRNGTSAFLLINNLVQ